MTGPTFMINLTAGVQQAKWQRTWEGFESFARTIREVEEPEYLSLTWTLVDGVTNEGDEFYDEGTLLRVYEALRRMPMPEKVAREAVTAMQNAGILFRERREPPAWTQAHYDTPGV